jgi:cell filamentation protein
VQVELPGPFSPEHDREVSAYVVNAVHPFREGNGRTQRAFFEQLAYDAGFTLAWQHLDAARNIATSVAIMGGDAAPMHKMLDELVQGR